MNALPNPTIRGRTAPLMNSAVRKALGVLLEGYDYAQDLQASPWEFAVELAVLLAEGCTPNTLRWLALRGYVEHAVRSTEGRARERPPQAGKGKAFEEGTRFVLTALGASVARSAMPPLTVAATPCSNGPEHAKAEPNCPVWDSLTGELRFQECLVRRFRNSASQQRVVLDAFQRNGWPKWIEDPLPHPPGERINVKERLRDTVKNLNREHQTACLQFYAADAGRVVGWKRLG